MDFLEEPLTEERMKAVREMMTPLVPQSATIGDPLMKVGNRCKGTERSKHALKRQRELLFYLMICRKRPKICIRLSFPGMSRRILLSTRTDGKYQALIADEPTPGMELVIAQKKPWEVFRSLLIGAMGYSLIFMILNWR